MKAIGVIPARLFSTRLDEKILADIGGKPMIEHVWERSSESQQLEKVIIACDDEKILHTAQDFGATALLTSKDHLSGSDRIAEAVEPIDVDIVVNIQGDEPLIEASIIDGLVIALEQDNECSMATVVKEFGTEDDKSDPNVVKVLIDQDGYAKTFSRRELNGEGKVFKHLGIYAYRKDFLLAFTKMERSENEMIEKLEQLRALDAGYKIKTIKTDIDTIGVDTPEDLERVKTILLSK